MNTHGHRKLEAAGKVLLQHLQREDGPPDTLILDFWPPRRERIATGCFKSPPFVLTFIAAPRMNGLPPTHQNTENYNIQSTKALLTRIPMGLAPCHSTTVLHEHCPQSFLTAHRPSQPTPSIPRLAPPFHSPGTEFRKRGGVARGHLAEPAFTSEPVSFQNLELLHHCTVALHPCEALSRGSPGWDLENQCPGWGWIQESLLLVQWAPCLVQRATVEPKETRTL